MSFVHLHCHSEYSLLDGANRIDDLIARALELEQPALAITDHGNLHAAWEFQEKAKKARLKPIIGIEAYVAPGDRRERGRPRPGAKPYYHLVLLAQNSAGYKNLVKLSSLAYTEGFYTKPRVDRELLAKYSEGIVVSSACMAGEVATHLLEGRYDEARATAGWYADPFKERSFLQGPGRPRPPALRPRALLQERRRDARALPRPPRGGREHAPHRGRGRDRDVEEVPRSVVPPPARGRERERAARKARRG